MPLVWIFRDVIKKQAGDHPQIVTIGEPQKRGSKPATSFIFGFCSPNLSPADSKQSETHCVVLQSLPPNPRARVPQGRDRFDPGGRWEVGFLPLLYLTDCS